MVYFVCILNSICLWVLYVVCVSGVCLSVSLCLSVCVYLNLCGGLSMISNFPTPRSSQGRGPGEQVVDYALSILQNLKEYNPFILALKR